MRKLTSLFALLALGVGMLGLTPAQATIAGHVSFICGGPGVIALGGNDGSGEFHSPVLPVPEGLPVANAGACPAGAGDVVVEFSSWHGDAGLPTSQGTGTVTLHVDAGGSITGASVDGGTDHSDVAVGAVGQIVSGAGSAVIVG